LKPDWILSARGAFAPQMVERVTQFEGNTLKIYYTHSTWNP